MDNVTSINLMDMPKNPTTHIQNIAPGPPNVIAKATPLIFPRPKVPDKAAERA